MPCSHGPAPFVVGRPPTAFHCVTESVSVHHHLSPSFYPWDIVQMTLEALAATYAPNPLKGLSDPSKGLSRSIILFLYSALLIPYSEAQLCRRYYFSNRPSFECTNAHLSEPPDIPNDVLSVTLFNNSMKVIERFPATYASVLSLQLQYNEIEKISPLSWDTLSSLKSLDLSHNALSSLVLSTSLQSLVTLSLAHNNLRFLPDLSTLKSLRILDVSFNSLYRVNPRSLPPNAQSVRLSHNRISALSPWPHLNQLQELDVSSNPLKCECSMWEWIAWADKRSLVDPAVLPCDEPIEHIRMYEAHKSVCGPMIESHNEIDRLELSLGEPAIICCMVSALPTPAVHWIHEGAVIGRGLTRKNIPETGRVRYCLEMNNVDVDSYGEYFCVASLGHKNTSKKFSIERHKEPLVLRTPDNFLFYAQFSLVVFLIVFCISSYCILRRDRVKTKTEDMYRNHIVQIVVDQDYEKPRLDSTESEGYCPSDDEEWGVPWHPKAVYAYATKRTSDAPLARFDPDSKSVLGLTNTAV